MTTKSKSDKPRTVPLGELGTSITSLNIHEHASEDMPLLRCSLEDLLQLPSPAPDTMVDVGALAAVWAALEGLLITVTKPPYGTGASHVCRWVAVHATGVAFDHVCRLLADEDLRWVLENRPRAALKWLAHLMDGALEPGPLDTDSGERDEGEEDSGDEDDLEGGDGLDALDRDTIRRQLDSGQMDALRTGRGAWYLSGRPRARASREAAMAACRLWAALETSLLRDFERQEIQPLFSEFRALCRDRHFQAVLEACPEAAAKWFHALSFQEDDEGMRTEEE